MEIAYLVAILLAVIAFTLILIRVASRKAKRQTIPEQKPKTEDFGTREAVSAGPLVHQHALEKYS